MTRNEDFTNLTVTNSITDGAGIMHTGELADLSDIPSDTHVDVENFDGSALVANVDAILAGTELEFSNDGDGSVTLDYTGQAGTDTHIDVENTDGDTFVASPDAVTAGTDLQFSDDGDSSVTLDYVGTEFSGSHDDLTDVASDDHHPKYTDSEAITAINNDGDHGSTASHNYFSGSHSDLSNIGTDDHHTRYSDEEAQDAVGTALGTGLSYDDAGNTISVNQVASGTATLSSGSAVISTGVTTAGTPIDVALDPSGNGNNGSDVKAAARSFWDNSAGEIKVEILEDGTSVGNPEVGYSVVAH